MHSADQIEYLATELADRPQSVGVLQLVTGCLMAAVLAVGVTFIVPPKPFALNMTGYLTVTAADAKYATTTQAKDWAAQAASAVISGIKQFKDEDAQRLTAMEQELNGTDSQGGIYARVERAEQKLVLKPTMTAEDVKAMEAKRQATTPAPKVTTGEGAQVTTPAPPAAAGTPPTAATAPPATTPPAVAAPAPAPDDAKANARAERMKALGKK